MPGRPRADGPDRDLRSGREQRRDKHRAVDLVARQRVGDRKIERARIAGSGRAVGVLGGRDAVGVDVQGVRRYDDQFGRRGAADVPRPDADAEPHLENVLEGRGRVGRVHVHRQHGPRAAEGRPEQHLRSARDRRDRRDRPRP